MGDGGICQRGRTLAFRQIVIGDMIGIRMTAVAEMIAIGETIEIGVTATGETIAIGEMIEIGVTAIGETIGETIGTAVGNTVVVRLRISYLMQSQRKMLTQLPLVLQRYPCCAACSHPELNTCPTMSMQGTKCATMSKWVSLI